MSGPLTTGKTQALVCPNCGEDIAADDVNMQLAIAFCRGCNHTVELKPQARPSPPRELMKLGAPPTGLTVEKRGGGLVIQRRWFALNPQFVFLALWCVVWDGFLVVWYSIGIASLLSGEGEALLMLLFPILHVAAGVAVTYTLAAMMVNRTTLEVSQSHLSVRHGPLPWKQPEPQPLKAIDQLYLVQKVNKNTRTFALVARRSDMTSVEILGGLQSDEQVRYLERRLEAHLGLDDVPVDGEYTG